MAKDLASFCLDVFTNSTEEYGELFLFLSDKEVCDSFGISEIRQGTWGGMDALRVITQSSRALEAHIAKYFRDGGGLSFDHFYNESLANKSKFWRPVHLKLSLSKTIPEPVV